MAESGPGVPESLLSAIRRDLRPVRPLLAPRQRALIVVGIAVAVALAFLAIVGMRPDLRDIPAPVFVIPLLLRLAMGMILIAIALREAVPAWGVPRTVAAAWLVGGALLLILLPRVVAILLSAVDFPFDSEQLVCYRAELLIALPALAVSYWLLARAYPLRPLLAALAVGMGAGFIADAALFAHCPIDAPTHVSIAHEGAVLSISVVGALLGWILQRWRVAR